MGNNESGVTGVFVAELRDQAGLNGVHFVDYPLGPQDRNVLSDSLFANNFDQFSLVEMKFSEVELKSEAEKRSRVEALCKELAKNPRMRKLHDQCHMIAWKDSKTDELRTSPYRHQICNQKVLGRACGLQATLPDNSFTVDVLEFAEKFFGDPSQHCLQREDFIEYLKMLLKVVTESKVTDLEVIARGISPQGKRIATTMTFDQLCDDLSIRAEARKKPRPKF